MFDQLSLTANFIQSVRSFAPKVGLVLGSGLSSYAEQVQDATTIAYHEIPGFHAPTVAGHPGQLIIGFIGNVPCVILQGRLHAYEGHPWADVVFAVRTLKLLGTQQLILTNAAGGIHPEFNPGTLAMITDHLNFTGGNPLQGPNIEQLGPRFPDMTKTYNPELTQTFQQQAQKLNIPLKQGIYAGVLGPTYETPAEIRMFRSLGADMVGMSTVAEAIAAHHAGLQVAGLSCITNKAAGLGETLLQHDHIKEEAAKVQHHLTQLLTTVISSL